MPRGVLHVTTAILTCCECWIFMLPWDFPPRRWSVGGSLCDFDGACRKSLNFVMSSFRSRARHAISPSGVDDNPRRAGSPHHGRGGTRSPRCVTTCSQTAHCRSTTDNPGPIVRCWRLARQLGTQSNALSQAIPFPAAAATSRRARPAGTRNRLCNQRQILSTWSYQGVLAGQSVLYTDMCG